jgi:cytochrome d ubiquinol oxidase subunit I
MSKKWLLRIALFSIPLGYLASQFGWIVAEVGRQPWAIQDLLPVFKATSHISVSAVQTTFFLLLILLTILFIAEIRILIKQIKVGPKE